MKKILFFSLMIIGLICFCACSHTGEPTSEPMGGGSGGGGSSINPPENFFECMDSVTNVTMQFNETTEVDLKIVDLLLASEFTEIEMSEKSGETGQQAHVIHFNDKVGEVYRMQYYPENIDSEDEIEALFILDLGEYSFAEKDRIKNKELVEFLKEYEVKVESAENLKNDIINKISEILNLEDNRTAESIYKNINTALEGENIIGIKDASDNVGTILEVKTKNNTYYAFIQEGYLMYKITKGSLDGEQIYQAIE